METYARENLKVADVDQVHIEIYLGFSQTENMDGLQRHLEELKKEIEAQEQDQVPPEQSTQPAGWTDEMTEFVEGSLCAGNDVQTTVNEFRLTRSDAFDIQGLEEHVEKLKREYRSKKPEGQKVQVSQEPVGWSDEMTAFIQEQLRQGDRDVAHMTLELEMENVDAVFLEGVSDYVERLKSDFEAQQ